MWSNCSNFLVTLEVTARDRSKVIKISSKLASHILKGIGVSEPQESSIKWLERGEWSNG